MLEHNVTVELHGFKVYEGLYVYLDGCVTRYRYDDYDGYHDDYAIHSTELITLEIRTGSTSTTLNLNSKDSSDFLDAHPAVEEALIQEANEMDWSLFEEVSDE